MNLSSETDKIYETTDANIADVLGQNLKAKYSGTTYKPSYYTKYKPSTYKAYTYKKPTYRTTYYKKTYYKKSYVYVKPKVYVAPKLSYMAFCQNSNQCKYNEYCCQGTYTY